MATNKITDLAYRNLKPADKEQNIADGGGLYIRIRSIAEGGAVSFRFRYLAHGKQIWMTIKAKSLPEARNKRNTFKDWLKQGKNPADEAKLTIERNRADQLAEQAELARLEALISVNHLFERWVSTKLIERKDLPEIKRMFAKDVLPVIGDLVVTEIKKGHITEVVDELIKRGSKHTARNVLKLMRQMFRFAVSRDVIEFDPTANLALADTTVKPTERDRVLSQDEIKLLKTKMPDAGFIPSTECAIWLMLSTLCRVGEISKAQWQHVDIQNKLWNIPAENSKNGKAHAIHLSDFALAQFQRLAEFKQHDIWLFSNRGGTGHVCDKSLSKQIDSRQNPVIHQCRTKANQSLVLPGGKWTPHDLRRSGATLMGDLGVSGDVIEKCLNHSEENKLKRVYQHQKLIDEKMAAWDLIGERLAVLTGDNANVLPFKRIKNLY
ncbi:integrase [Methylomonas lenta]|uniref:Integrase n=1 Tax=Methylomonas lenta TaxID=980561 RepID=A0A177NH78_9GAMM|nr:site-specific integrase [Methylomonas lenta]OAI16559.1 integrase [Methylomonas lenta]